jgi:hypothetical protein
VGFRGVRERPEVEVQSLCCSPLPSQELVLPKVHPLNDVPTVVEDPADVFRVDGAGKMGVTIVPAVSAGCADPLKSHSETQILQPSGHHPLDSITNLT